MESIKVTIMKRDGISEAEADEQIAEAREAFEEYIDDGDLESAENVCSEFFGLESDYIFEIM